MLILRGSALMLSLLMAACSPIRVPGLDDCGTGVAAVLHIGTGLGLIQEAGDTFGFHGDAQVQCPQCGSADVIRIVYGYPTEETLQRAEAGEVRLGGCVVGSCDPNTYCKQCGHEWMQR